MARPAGEADRMSVVLVFLVVVIGFSFWWLVQQRVTSKPWLEVGPDPLGGPDEFGMPTQKIALGVFLAVVGALFALFASAYFMRMDFVDWRPMPLPGIVWLNTGLLVLASVLLHCARVALRQGDVPTLRLGLCAGMLATLGFLAGQFAAWRALMASGLVLTESPATSFFYLLTGLHGLHILVGVVVLAAAVPWAWGVSTEADGRRHGRHGVSSGSRAGLTLRLELCTTYWDFLLLVWLGLLTLFAGWATSIVVICRQLIS
jgi:cytochrome c oxidase subunit III